MSKYKRVWAMLGAVGLLGALMALAAVTPAATPAGATLPDNTITLNKIVSGTVEGFVGQPFVISVNCPSADHDGNPVTPPQPFQGGAQFDHTGTPIGSNVVTIPAVYTNCTVFEFTTLGADDSIVQAFGAPNTNVAIAAGFDATLPSLVTFPADGGGAATFFVVNSFDPVVYNTVRVTKATTGPVPANAVFEITASCNDGGFAYEASTVFVGGGGTTDLLVPTTCTGITVDETVAFPAPASSDTNGNGDASIPYDVTFNPPPASGQVRQVTVTNNYEGGPVNQVTVRKTVLGTAPAGTTFAGQVTCTDNGPGPDVTRNWSFGSTGGSTVLSFPATAGQPLDGENCTAVETGTGGAS